MKSGWVDRDAEAIVAEGAKSGIDRDLALRIYTTRLLGRDPKLVLHGGGNTSLKEVMRDRLGADVEVLRVKATGADMAMTDLAGLPAVRLAPLRKLRALGEIGDDELVGIERSSLIDPAAGTQTAAGGTKSAVCVISAGSNGQIETAYSQPVTTAVVGGDDIAVRVQ